MKTLWRVSAVVAGTIVLSCILACGAVSRVRDAAARTKTANDLKQLALAYHEFHEANRRGPANAQEWAAGKVSPEAKPLIAQTGPGGQYVFYWNVKLPELTQGASRTVLGYESKVPTSGGMVAMADGAVQMMTAQEFQAAAKPPQDGDKK